MIKETKNGWIDLSNLKTRGKSLDWEKSVGVTIPFQYDDVVSELYIKEKVSSQYVLIDIPGYVENVQIYVGQIKNNQLGALIGARRSDFRYDSGNVVGDIKILEAIYKPDKHDKKYYRCKCLIDGYEWELRESHILAGIGCPVCAGKAVMRGYNDIATERPDLIKYFRNVEDAYVYRTHSNKYIDFQCPHCGLIKKRQIQDVVCRGFSCSRCGDGKSYPNKFVFNVLLQLLGEDGFEDEYVFEWSKSVSVPWKPEGKKMVYDLYVPQYSMITENHGAQHYVARGFGTLADVDAIQQNDAEKRNLAFANGISTYIELDCRESSMDFIKHSIMTSELPTIIGFSENDVDWNLCDRYASGSLLVDSCRLWNAGEYDKKIIAKELNVHPSTVSKYLTKGRKLGLIAS